MEIQKVKTISEIAKYDNANDTERVYAISANTKVTDKKVNNFDNGEVYKDSALSASFAKYGDNLSINYHAVETAEERIIILTAVEDFLTSVTAFVEA